MNARERIELSHWRPEFYRTLRDAGIDSSPTLHRAEDVISTVGWVFFFTVIAFAMWG